MIEPRPFLYTLFADATWWKGGVLSTESYRLLKQAPCSLISGEGSDPTVWLNEAVQPWILPVRTVPTEQQPARSVLFSHKVISRKSYDSLIIWLMSHFIRITLYATLLAASARLENKKGGGECCHRAQTNNINWLMAASPDKCFFAIPLSLDWRRKTTPGGVMPARVSFIFRDVFIEAPPNRTV